MQETRSSRFYDYIIHDVFTGGAEPLELFTAEFLTGLSNLLSPEGTIAINYGGDLFTPSARSVIATVLSVFPRCRLFRESPASESPRKEDFTNLVMFCRKTIEDFHFRKPIEADLLGSPARKQHLLPRNEITNATKMLAGDDPLIKQGQTNWLKDSQLNSAKGHWYVMRKVLPDIVWETW